MSASSSSFQAKQFFSTIESAEDLVTSCLDEHHPLELAVNEHDADTHTWYQAINGADTEGFWEYIWL